MSDLRPPGRAFPEKLTSRFEMTHAMVLNVLAGSTRCRRDPGEHLVASPQQRRSVSIATPHLRHSTSMKQAGVVEHVSPSRASASGELACVATRTCPTILLNQPLLPSALAALELLDLGSDLRPDVVSNTESVLEDSPPLSRRRRRRGRGRDEGRRVGVRGEDGRPEEVTHAPAG